MNFSEFSQGSILIWKNFHIACCKIKTLKHRNFDKTKISPIAKINRFKENDEVYRENIVEKSVVKKK